MSKSPPVSCESPKIGQTSYEGTDDDKTPPEYLLDQDPDFANFKVTTKMKIQMYFLSTLSFVNSCIKQKLKLKFLDKF